MSRSRRFLVVTAMVAGSVAGVAGTVGMPAKAATGGVVSCTTTSRTVRSGPTALTTVGTTVCSGPVQQTGAASISLYLYGLAELGSLSSSSGTCASCEALPVKDTATALPVPLSSYEGAFVDFVTAPAGTTIVPGRGCTTVFAPNEAYCTASSRFTFPL